MNQLEQAFDDAAGPLLERCSTCGGPDPSANTFIRLGPREEIPRCPGCGDCVDHDGRTLRQPPSKCFLPIIILRSN